MSEAGGPGSKNGHDRAVVVTAERRLLAGMIRMLLEQREDDASWDLADVAPKDAAPLTRIISDLRNKYSEGVAVLLVDPVTSDWETAAGAIRRDKKVAVVVLTARPSYELQRRWRAKGEHGQRLASGMLSLESRPDDILGALKAALDRPKETGYWLERTVDAAEVHVHPAAFYATEAGRKAETLRSKPEDYRALLLAGEGLSTKEIGQREHIETETSRARLNRAMEDLGARTDVELGRLASELGLFLDLPPN